MSWCHLARDETLFHNTSLAESTKHPLYRKPLSSLGSVSPRVIIHHRHNYGGTPVKLIFQVSLVQPLFPEMKQNSLYCRNSLVGEACSSVSPGIKGKFSLSCSRNVLEGALWSSSFFPENESKTKQNYLYCRHLQVGPALASIFFLEIKQNDAKLMFCFAKTCWWACIIFSRMGSGGGRGF